MRRHVIRCDACGREANWDRVRLSPEAPRWATLSTVRGRVDLCPTCADLARVIPLRAPSQQGAP